MASGSLARRYAKAIIALPNGQAVAGELRSLAELVTVYLTSPVNIQRDLEDTTPGLKGFTKQPTAMAPAEVAEPERSE